MLNGGLGGGQRLSRADACRARLKHSAYGRLVLRCWLGLRGLRWVLLLALVLAACAASCALRRLKSYRAALPRDEDCGFPGISEHTCVSAGCAFLKRPSGRWQPQCVPRGGAPPSLAAAGWNHTCAAQFSADCGYPGVTRDVCESLGCCFDHDRVPSCFFPAPTPTAQRMREPLISVVVPCYGQEEYVGAAIVSVLQQAYTNWELLVVDDGTPGERCALTATRVLGQFRVLNKARARSPPFTFFLVSLSFLPFFIPLVTPWPAR